MGQQHNQCIHHGSGGSNCGTARSGIDFSDPLRPFQIGIDGVERGVHPGNLFRMDAKLGWRCTAWVQVDVVVAKSREVASVSSLNIEQLVAEKGATVRDGLDQALQRRPRH